MNRKDRVGIHLSDAVARVAVQMSGGGVIRVLVRSASPFTRSGLENAISADPRFEIVNERSSSFELEQGPDVILLDGAEPDLEKLSSTSLSAHTPHRVLLADDVNRLELARLVKLGVRALLPRDSSVQEIAVALEAVTQDLVAISPELLETLLPAASEDREEENEYLQEPLTARETEVLALLAEGAGNKEIAAKLSISEHTAKFHVSSILSKLGATTRTEAVTRGYRLGLIFI
ncbi:MAG: response regulator transcription factor [Terracidiphilus sp.]